MSREAMKRIKTWNERCEEHPDHQTGMISERMIQERMQEEIDELRQALETDLAKVGEVGVWGEWQGLTDEEINSVYYKRDWTAHWTNTTFARAIEAKLKEKNHG